MRTDYILLGRQTEEFVDQIGDWLQKWERERAVAREIEARREIDDRTVVSSRGLRYTTDLHADPRWGGRNPTLLGSKDTRRRVSTRRVLP